MHNRYIVGDFKFTESDCVIRIYNFSRFNDEIPPKFVLPNSAEGKLGKKQIVDNLFHFYFVYLMENWKFFIHYSLDTLWRCCLNSVT